VEERAPNGFVRIEDVISRHELDSIANSFAAAAGLDVETVNNRLSLVNSSQRTAYQSPRRLTGPARVELQLSVWFGVNRVD
jgi:hypothetical protein